MIKNYIENLIRLYVMRSNEYVFLLDNNYYIPKFLYKEKKKINLLKYRNKFLNNQSQYSLNFKEDLEKLGYNFIQEFTIIIIYKDIWEEILNTFGIIDESTRSITYFSLDYYLPDIGLAIEIDSDYHKNRELYDKARDIYIENMYGINTLRFYNYGDNAYKRKEYLSLLKQSINTKTKYITSWNLTSRIFFDYSSIITENFIKDNEKELIILEKFITGYGIEKFIRDNIIEITEGEFLNYIGQNKESEWSIKLFCILVNRLISGKQITVYMGIYNYQYIFIKNIFNLRYNMNWNLFLRKYKNIPAWIPQIVYNNPVPTKYRKRILRLTEEDKNIIELFLTSGNP